MVPGEETQAAGVLPGKNAGGSKFIRIEVSAEVYARIAGGNVDRVMF
jgi:hypothetical protein